MIDTRAWARRRQIAISTVIGFMVLVLGYSFYTNVLYVAPTCFDGEHNGDERGVDCGSGCARICAFDALQPRLLWAEAFRVFDDQYNVVAYIENPNDVAATAEFTYTIILRDENGVIGQPITRTIGLPSDNIYPIFEGRVRTGARVPTEVDVVMEPVTEWYPLTDSRSQFRLLDRGEIKRADSKPRLQSSIRNESRNDFKDIPVVVTIFDSQDTPLTASRTFEDFPAETVTTVNFSWPEPIATTLRSCEVPTDVVLAIDLSGSMNNLGGLPAEPINSVRKAAETFVNRLGENDRVSVVTFATDAETVIPLRPQPATAAAVIANLQIDPEEETGSTNSGAALARAYDELTSDRHNEDARKVVVLLTDGLTNEPEPEPEQFAITWANQLKAADTTIYTIGLGEDINEAFLRSVASPAGYYRSITVAEIDQVYRSITEAICEEGAARVDVIPLPKVEF